MKYRLKLTNRTLVPTSMCRFVANAQSATIASPQATASAITPVPGCWAGDARDGGS